jgi:predicted nucleic acid-binding protein
MNAVDTNVYVYSLDRDEPAKQAKAIALFDRLVQQPGDTVLIWQVAAEFLAQLRKWQSQGPLDAERGRGGIPPGARDVLRARSDRGNLPNIV